MIFGILADFFYLFIQGFSAGFLGIPAELYKTLDS